MKALQKSIVKFNKAFNVDIYASVNVHDTMIQIVIHYGQSNDSKMYFNTIKEAIDNINQTYVIWMEAK